jgi:aspartate racemase
MIGVLGGMGPLATLDFFSKVLAATPAKGDADHVPMLIQTDPRIPARPAAILSGGLSPLPELLAGRNRLVAAGATALVMPCNTAHYWYADLQDGCPVPFLSIVDASLNELSLLADAGSTIGIIATRATLASKIFDPALIRLSYKVMLPEDIVTDTLILPGIELVKLGDPLRGGHLIEQAVQALLDQGAHAVILACTETPLALDAAKSPLRIHCVDSTAALARTCVAWWLSQPVAFGSTEIGDGLARP